MTCTVLPHFFFGLFKTVRDKINILKGGDEALLIAGGLRFKWLDYGLV